MIRKGSCTSWLWLQLLLLALLAPKIPSQPKWKINAESGILQTKINDGVSRNDLLTRLEGAWEYQLENNGREAAFKAKARPEFLNFSQGMHSFRGRLSGSYSQVCENSGFNASVYLQKYFLFQDEDVFLQDIFVLKSDAAFQINTTQSLTCGAGYGFQSFEAMNNQSIDMFFIDIQLKSTFIGFSNYRYGLYAERFSFSHQTSNVFGRIDLKKSGYRIGPHLGLRYDSDLLIDMDYKFLFHFSEIIKSPSFEQTLRFVTGKIFADDFSLLLLFDFNWKKLLFKSTTNSYTEIVYSPIDQENRLLLKFGYDLSDCMEVYLQGGYLKENALSEYSEFDGWNAILGIEISEF